MSKLCIDYVSTPFAGHLHPLLELAQRLECIASVQSRFLSTQGAWRAIDTMGFPFVRLLEGRDQLISNIANAPKQVGSNPFRLWEQLRDNLSMMGQLVDELRGRWELNRPDLVIVDFAVPVAGLLARSMSIPWWTSLTSVSAMETPDGVPTYLGGWKPMPGRIGDFRNMLGRSLVRTFKRTMHRIFREQLVKLGIPNVYREDGYETIYSPEAILALSPSEFEFPRRWPSSIVFLGPMTHGPQYDHEPPTFIEGKPHVLVSLGTHVRWAKQKATTLIQSLAKRMPDVEFHFSLGAVDGHRCTRIDNYQEFAYFPYDAYMNRYSASINHGGTGVLFSCLRHGVPVLIWPQDFDQFDHAARVEFFGLGIRCEPKISSILRDLARILEDREIRQRVEGMRNSIASYDPESTLSQLISRLP